MADEHGPAGTAVSDLVDIERYPVADLEDPQARALIEDSRARLERTGICSLPGFLRPGVAARLAAEASALLPLAHRQDHEDIAYGRYRDRLDSFPARPSRAPHQPLPHEPGGL